MNTGVVSSAAGTEQSLEVAISALLGVIGCPVLACPMPAGPLA